MAGEEGFEVYEREGVGGGVEDLHVPRCLAGARRAWLGGGGGYGTYL